MTGNGERLVTTVSARGGKREENDVNAFRLGGTVAALGGGLLILSETVEVAGGGFSRPSFAVTIAAFFVLAAGIWGLHAGQARGGGRVSLIGATLFSVGASLEGVADVIGFGAATEAGLQARTGLLVPVGFVILILGAILFGVAALRAGVYPRWAAVMTMVVTMVAPILLPFIFALGLPLVLTSLANAALGAAFVVMGLRARSGQTRTAGRRVR